MTQMHGNHIGLAQQFIQRYDLSPRGASSFANVSNVIGQQFHAQCSSSGGHFAANLDVSGDPGQRYSLGATKIAGDLLRKKREKAAKAAKKLAAKREEEAPGAVFASEEK